MSDEKQELLVINANGSSRDYYPFNLVCGAPEFGDE